MEVCLLTRSSQSLTLTNVSVTACLTLRDAPLQVDYWARRQDQKKLSDAYASAVNNLGNVVSFLA